MLPRPPRRRRPLPGAVLAAAVVAAAAAASCSTAPRASEVVTDTRNRAAEATRIGNSYFRQGRYDLALRFFTEALQYNTSVDNREGVIQSTNSIGRVDMALGATDEAERLFTRAIAQAAGGRQELVVLSKNNLGELYLARGELERALAVFEELLSLPPAGGMTDEQRAMLHHNRGSARRNLGDPAGARQDLERSLSMNLAAKRTDEAAADYYMLASVDSKQGDLEGANRNLELALDLDKKVENSLGISKDLYALGIISTRRGDMASAYDFFERAYRVSTTLSMKADMRRALAGLIAAAEALGRTAEAEDLRKMLAELGPAQ